MVHVLMSSYNGQKYISDQIESIVSQKYVNVKLYIRDDGSSDSTVEIIKKYVDKRSGNIRLYIGENIGWRRSFIWLLKNTLNEIQDSDFVAFSDQDDVWTDTRLYDSLLQIPTDIGKPVLHISNVYICDKNLKIIKKHCLEQKNMMQRPFEQLFISPSMPAGLSYIFNREAVRNVLLLEGYNYAHDTLTYLVCLSIGRVIYSDTPRIMYRQHDTNVVGASLPLKKRILNKFYVLTGKRNEENLQFLSELMLQNFEEEKFNKEALGFINKIVDLKKGIIKRIVFITRYDLRRETLLASLMLYLKIIMGKL